MSDLELVEDGTDPNEEVLKDPSQRTTEASKPKEKDGDQPPEVDSPGEIAWPDEED